MDFDELAERAADALEATDLARTAQLLDEAGAMELDDEQVEDLAVLWEDLADAYADRGRIDEAIATVERWTALGRESAFDTRVAVAAYRTRGGLDAEEAHALWDALDEERPDNTWLQFRAGVAFLDTDQPVEALPWLTSALDGVVTHGDHEGLLADLIEMRDEALAGAGEEHDDLQARAEAMFDRQVRHLGHDPLEARRVAVKTAFAWFPESEWAGALERWPDLAEGNDGNYREYVRALQSQLVEDAAAKPALAPLYLDAYVTWADARDEDPAQPETRAAYAAEVARLGNEVPWPPGRNEPCWCGSGEKYKKCCATAA